MLYLPYRCHRYFQCHEARRERLMSPVTARTDAIPPVAPASIWSRPHRFLTLGLLLVIAGAAFEALAVATILPATVRDLGSPSLYGWVFSAFMLADLVGIVLAGTESDRRGPARPFVAGVVCFAGGLVLAGLAPFMLVVIVGRTVQ